MDKYSKIIIVFLLIFSYYICDVAAQSMEWLCKPGIYSDIQYMGNELFKVKDGNNKCGIISSENRVVVEVKYDSITHFVENRALILDKNGNRIIAILDSTGEILKSFENDQIYTTVYPYYKEGFLSFKDSNGLCGYLNNKGNISINAKFYLAAPFNNEIATVQYAEGNGYYGLINKSGGSAFISDTKYRFLSTVVDGKLFAVTSSSRGGDLLRVMEVKGNQLKAVKTIESKMFVDISDDFTYLVSQNGHHYYIDNQWRITRANYDYNIPYNIEDKSFLVTEHMEYLSKQRCENGLQITYLGQPILEHSFDFVKIYEKKYAIVNTREQTIGILKLNTLAEVKLEEPLSPFVFYHNTELINKTDSIDLFDEKHYIKVIVDIKDINTELVKCYLIEKDKLLYAPLKQYNGKWNLYIPYFKADTQFNNIISPKIKLLFVYDDLEWLHKTLKLSTKHEPGYDIFISGSDNTNEMGQGLINITVKTKNGVPQVQPNIEVSGRKTITMRGAKKVISIPIDNIPKGESRTFTYSVTVSEDGCPSVRKTVSKTIIHPKNR